MSSQPIHPREAFRILTLFGSVKLESEVAFETLYHTLAPHQAQAIARLIALQSSVVQLAADVLVDVIQTVPDALERSAMLQQLATCLFDLQASYSKGAGEPQ